VLVLGRLDREEDLPLLHGRAVGVALRLEEAADARADVDVGVAVEDPDRLDVERDVLLGDRAHDDGGGGRRLRGAGFAATAHEGGAGRERGRGEEVSVHALLPKGCGTGARGSAPPL